MATTNAKLQLIVKIAEEEYLALHPETDAEVVHLAAAGITADNVKDALLELKQLINDITGGGVVTGVKGAAESSYRQGNVSLSAENVGADPAGTAQSKVTEHNSSGTAHSDIRDAASAAQTKADQAYSLAQGRAKGTSYNTVDAMTAALKAASSTDFKVGDTLYIKATGVPDYWISAVLDNNSGTYGYYEISELETEKVDLTDYQTKNDSSLQTTDKTVVGAVNEVRNSAAAAASAASAAQSAADANEAEIAKIVAGTTKVGSAAEAETAGSAGQADKLATARVIELTGDVTGSATFDGSQDEQIAMMLKNTGVTAGTYSAVQVDAKGRVLKGSQIYVLGDEGEDTPPSDLPIGAFFLRRL